MRNETPCETFGFFVTGFMLSEANVLPRIVHAGQAAPPKMKIAFPGHSDEACPGDRPEARIQTTPPRPSGFQLEVILSETEGLE
ncbi:MAG: hypothetical protein HY670_09800 [Chloroflexi bacterium]|nr:hypothetical protein [Chloroflexota bacterium]